MCQILYFGVSFYGHSTKQENLTKNKATHTRLPVLSKHFTLLGLSTWSRRDCKSPHKHGQKQFRRLYLVVIIQVLQCSKET